jgi:integrase
MPVYRKPNRGKDAWNVVIWVKGKRHDRTFHGKKADAEAYEARERVKLEAGHVLESRAAPRFVDFCVSHYRPHAETHLRPSTWKVRRYQIETLCAQDLGDGTALGDLKLTDISAEAIERFKQARRREGRKPRSINNELAVLQAVTTYAREIKVPCASFKVKPLPVVGRGRVTFWDDVQLVALLASVERHAADLMGPVVFLANTGCRKGEALAAERAWINLPRRMIEIPVSEVWQPKTNEPREVPISGALLPWIERALARPGRWLFPSSKPDAEGRPQRFAFWPKRAFDRARKLAGRCERCEERDPAGATGERCASCAPQLRGGPHTLRHTFASHFLRAVPDIYLLAKVLGHSEARTTKLYSHLLPDHLERARDAVSIAPGVGPAALEARRRWAGAAR